MEDRISGDSRWRRAGQRAVLLCALAMLLGCTQMINGIIFQPQEDVVVAPGEIGITYQEVWFQARDGVRLNGWLVPGDSKHRLILLFHGNAGNLSTNLDYLALLHDQGFPLFIFDYRGYGKSGGEPRWENDVYEDGRAALAYLEEKGWRHEEMIYYGQSLGAAVALQMALESPPAGLVMEGAFTSMKDMAKYYSTLGYITNGWWGAKLAFDNSAKIDKAGVPLLLIHGDHDPIAPVKMGLRLFEQAAQPKTLYIIRDGGHCDAFLRDRPGYLEVLNRYLAGVSQAAAVRINHRHRHEAP